MWNKYPQVQETEFLDKMEEWVKQIWRWAEAVAAICALEILFK